MKKIQPKNKKATEQERAARLRAAAIERGDIPSPDESLEQLNLFTSALSGGAKADDVTAAKQIRHALTMFANTLPVDKALEVTAVFPEWEPSVNYAKDNYVRYGLNQDNEPQLYRIISPHVSQSDWTPAAAASLFVKVGFTDAGIPVWVQPMGAHDAYMKGDVVSYNNTQYTSDVDGNVWQPGVYGWTKKLVTGAKK